MIKEHIAEYWAKPTDALFSALDSSPDGLSSKEAAARLAQFGPNALETRIQAGPLKMFLGQFKDPIIMILIAATIISVGTGEWIDAVIILAIILGSAILSFYQEYSAGNAAEKLRAQVSLKANVFRDGQSIPLLAAEIVPGDVVMLSAGSLVPADGILLEAQDCFINQATLTGETFPVQKTPGTVSPDASLTDRTNSIFMGTNVRSGTAKVLIVETGTGTVFGQIAKRLTLRPPETEFERGIRRLGYMLTRVMFILVLLVFAINVFYQKPVIDSLLFSIALAVGLTPQLLPAIISITLSRGSQRMAENGVIVRRLASIENFGSMDTLCTDKTGTLTLGVATLDGAMDLNGQPSEDVFRFAYLNAHFETGLANALDEAILAKSPLDIAGYTKIAEIPYDFIRKLLTIVVKDKDGSSLLVSKGALDNVLAKCTHVQMGDGVAALDKDHLAQVQGHYAEWSEKGYRVLGVAVRTDNPAEHPRYTRDDEYEMTFVGFLLFFDPPKPGVEEVIADLSRQGVQLKIITGDNKLVTQHIAEAVKIPVTGVLTGAELARLSDEALWHTVEHINLFSEVDPNQKERIILALKKSGHVVGYMGDGINDAPALHAADVSISVDTAVDVAKDAADFVLLKQDLSVLHQGIVLGRTTFANTLKYVFTTISANFGNMFSMAGASLFLPFLPMLPMQILLTNFLTDFPSMNIASDHVDRELVEKPRRWDVAFIQRFMITFGLTSSIFDYLTFGLLILVFKANEEQFHTGWFLESILTELLIVFIVRTQKPFYRSKPGRILVIATIAVAVITLALPYSPLNHYLGLVALPLTLIFPLVGITLLYLILSETVKHYFYKRENGKQAAP
jgi:Mg2+-importing ATPase